MNPSDSPIKNALVRALIGGLLSAAAVYLGLLATGKIDAGEQTAIVAGALAFLGYVGPRLGIEGTIDNANDQQRVADTAKAEERALTAGRKGTG